MLESEQEVTECKRKKRGGWGGGRCSMGRQQRKVNGKSGEGSKGGQDFPVLRI